MKAEHDIFTNVSRAFLGDEGVLEMRDLVIQALDIYKKERDAFLKRIVDFEELPDTYFDILQSLENDDLARVLISGYYATEDLYMLHPIPNFIFTKDLAVTLKDHILVTKAAKEARERENLLARLIIWEHPIFKELNRPPILRHNMKIFKIKSFCHLCICGIFTNIASMRFVPLVNASVVFTPIKLS